MADMLQGDAGQDPELHDHAQDELHTSNKATPRQRTRRPSKRAHAQKAAEHLAAQLEAEAIDSPSDEAMAVEDCGIGQEAESSFCSDAEADEVPR